MRDLNLVLTRLAALLATFLLVSLLFPLLQAEPREALGYAALATYAFGGAYFLLLRQRTRLRGARASQDR